MWGWHSHSWTEDRKAFSWKLLARSFQFVKPYWLALSAVALLVTIVGASELAGPYLLKVAIDENIAKSDFRGLSLTAGMYVLLQLVNWGGGLGRSYLMGWIGQRIIYDLRMAMFSHLQRLSLRYFSEKETGDIMSHFTNDVEALHELLSDGMVVLVHIVLRLVGTMVMMLSLSPELAMWTFTILPLLSILSWAFQKRARGIYRRTRLKIAELTTKLEEGIAGIRVIQSFTHQEQDLEEFQGINAENRDTQLEAASLRSIYMPLIDFLGAAGIVLILFIGGRQVIAGGLQVGVLVAFVAYIGRFFQPISMLAMLYNGILTAMAAAERIFHLLDTQPEVKEAASPIGVDGLEGEIEFKDVSFHYQPEVPVLDNVSFRVPARSSVALVGPTGVGKSTLVGLLMRFYDPTGGAILVDGHDLRELGLKSYRDRVGMVLQEGFLFSGSIKENIRFGKLSATDEEIVAAAKAVGAHEFIERLPEGYDTDVRERGSKLSIGERQLICLARALISDPAILILDEATSSVDPYTETLIQQALAEAFATRTAVVIAHRLSTVRNMDRIYVLEGGRVVETGTHGELLARGSLYRHLYEMQLKGQAKAVPNESGGS